MGQSCSKACLGTDKEQKEFQCLTRENIEKNDYILVDLDYWNEPDCLVCLEVVKYNDPKCIQCDINGCKIISHADCMNRWYKENRTCPICHSFLPKRPEIHFAHDTVNIAKKIQDVVMNPINLDNSNSYEVRQQIKRSLRESNPIEIQNFTNMVNHHTGTPPEETSFSDYLNMIENINGQDNYTRNLSII